MEAILHGPGTTKEHGCWLLSCYISDWHFVLRTGEGKSALSVRFVTAEGSCFSFSSPSMDGNFPLKQARQDHDFLVLEAETAFHLMLSSTTEPFWCQNIYFTLISREIQHLNIFTSHHSQNWTLHSSYKAFDTLQDQNLHVPTSIQPTQLTQTSFTKQLADIYVVKVPDWRRQWSKISNLYLGIELMLQVFCLVICW